LIFEKFFRPDHYRSEEVGDGTGEVDKALERRITEYDRDLEGIILELLKLEPHIALSEEQYGVNSSHAIVMMRPRKIEEYKYMSVLSVFDIATSYIGGKI